MADKKKSPPNAADEQDGQQSAFSRLVVTLFSFLQKKKRAQSKARSEFRFNINTDHPNYIFEADETRNEYHAVGLTHEEKTFGKANMPLKHNPKKGDERAAYVRNGIIKDDQRSFSKKKMKNMQFSSDDMPNVKSKIRKYKTERRKKGKNKGDEPLGLRPASKIARLPCDISIALSL